jgi:hypothetical protein
MLSARARAIAAASFSITRIDGSAMTSVGSGAGAVRGAVLQALAPQAAAAIAQRRTLSVIIGLESASASLDHPRRGMV